MSDDNDDPVMALLATQRAVLAAVENLAGQVETMQGKVGAMSETLDQLVAGTAGTAAKGGVQQTLSLGDRYRRVSAEEAERDPQLWGAHSHYRVAEHIANHLHKDDPEGAMRESIRVREWIAGQLDKGRIFDLAKLEPNGNRPMVAGQPIYEEMFSGRIKVSRQPDQHRETDRER